MLNEVYFSFDVLFTALAMPCHIEMVWWTMCRNHQWN